MVVSLGTLVSSTVYMMVIYNLALILWQKKRQQTKVSRQNSLGEPFKQKAACHTRKKHIQIKITACTGYLNGG